MSIFSRLLSDKASLGGHPDSALVTKERGEGRSYIFEKYQCPSCNKKRNKDIRGHATVLRKKANGNRHVYDVYNVLCGCGKFSAFWSDASSWLASHIGMVDMMCKPDGKCHAISGNGQLPQMERSLFE